MARLYFWRVTYSGTVIEPEEVRRKRPEEATRIQWELTFEDPPFFRSFSSSEEEVFRRYDRAIRELVKEQELKSATWVSKSRRLGAFTWSRWVDARKVPEALRKIYERLNLTEEEKEMLERGIMKVPLIPTFRVDDWSIEMALAPVELPPPPPVGILERLRRWILRLMGRPVPEAPAVTTARDRYRFALYRPPFDRDDLIAEWEGDFVHDL
jgi:hypothetical protein